MKKPLIFLHIPKAGGSTLRKLLHQQYTRNETCKIESDINGNIRRFNALDSGQRQQIKRLTGHMAYGLHTQLAGAKYLTFLRDPIKRVVSEFQFISTNPYHVLYSSVSQMSLTDYLQCGLSSQISNGQTRLIAGVSQEGQLGVPGTREIKKIDYQKALNNLQQNFILPGILDFYDETLLLWAKKFNWSKPYYPRKPS